MAPALSHESGPVRESDWAPERVAVMAHWSDDPVPSRSVVAMLRALDDAGFATMLVSASPVPGPLGRVCTWAPGAPALPESTTVLRRANLGYDFGSWSTALAAFPQLSSTSEVVLVNDSLVGPLASLDPVLADLDASREPVWGLSGSGQHRRHVQSFFVRFAPGTLGHPRLLDFWDDVRVEVRKAKVVRYNELGLSEVLDAAGIGWRTMRLPSGPASANPTMAHWADWLDAGIPLLKRELVLTPPDTVADWDLLDERVRGLCGEGVRAWLAPGSELSAPRRRLTPAQRVRLVSDVEGPLGVLRAAAAKAGRALR